MGCCLSPPQAVDKESAAASSTVATRQISPSTHWRESSWKRDAKDIWKRPLAELPVHLDLPRLGSRMTVIRDGVIVCRGEEMVSANDDTENKPEILRRVFRCLAEQLENAETQQRVISRFEEYIKETGDISQQLFGFLQDVITDNSRIGLVLKAVHQRIVFPGFYSIRNNLYNKLPFNDKRGTWRVAIEITSDSIKIRHRKRQQAKSNHIVPANTYAKEEDFTYDFEFEWELVFEFDGELRDMQNVNVSIVELIISEHVDPQRREEIRSIVGEYYKV